MRVKIFQKFDLLEVTFLLRRNSKHKEVLLTQTLHEVMFSLRISIVNEQIHRYLQVPLS